MKDAEFYRLKEAWLRKHFAEVASKPGDGGVISTVPALFRADLFRPRTRSAFTRPAAGRDRFVLTPVLAKGGDLKESLAALFDEVVYNPKTWQEGLNLYYPKPGQTAGIIKIDEPYVVVHHDDPEHRHGSPRLIDFLCIDILPQPGGRVLFEKGSLEGEHCHFLIE